MNKFFIVGSGTGVGKSVLALLFMRILAHENKKPYYYKWIQTGCLGPDQQESDAGFIDRAMKAAGGVSSTAETGWFFESAKSPLHAANDAGVKADRDGYMNSLARLAQALDCLVVEPAGGLMVPITEKSLTIDLLPQAVEMGFRLVLAAGAGLGTINHVLLSLEALRNRGLPLGGLFLMIRPEDMVDERLFKQNKAAIENFGQVKVDAVIPPIADFSRLPDAALLAVSDFLKK